jgi:hypothetical protein
MSSSALILPSEDLRRALDSYEKKKKDRRRGQTIETKKICKHLSKG